MIATSSPAALDLWHASVRAYRTEVRARACARGRRAEGLEWAAAVLRLRGMYRLAARHHDRAAQWREDAELAALGRWR